MREQRTSQESEIVMSFFSPASRWESFELGPVLCPDAQMTFFFFRSGKKNCCWKSLNITLWQETKDQTYFLREIVTMEKENAPLKFFRRKICSVVQRNRIWHKSKDNRVLVFFFEFILSLLNI